MKPKKLIRNKIVNKLKPGEWEDVNDLSELNKLYALKIHEELIEIERSNYSDVWEFADLVEVAFSFARLHGFSFDHIITTMTQKRNSNGSFERIALNNLNPENPSNEIYFEAFD